MRLASVLLRRWYLYLVILLVLPIAALLYGRQHLRMFETTAQIYVMRPAQLSELTAPNYNQYLQPNQNEANVMNELLQSQTFTAGVAEDTGLARSYNLSTRDGQAAAAQRIQSDVLIVASGAGPDAIIITVQDKDAHIAEDIANAYITHVIQYDATTQLTLDKEAEAFYQQQANSAKGRVDQDQQKILDYQQAHPTVLTDAGAANPQYQQLQNQYKQDQDYANQIQSSLTTIQLDEAAARSGVLSIHVQDAPQLPLAPTYSTKKLLVYGGGGLGGALAIILLIVGFITIMDRKVYSVHDIEAVFTSLELDLPDIEMLPVISQHDWRANPEADRPLDLPRALAPVLAPRHRTTDRPLASVPLQMSNLDLGGSGK